MKQARGRLWAIWRSVAAALLFVVATHAAAPPAEALSRTSGSAFGSTTAEVSLKSRARIVVVRDDQRIEPPLPVAVRPSGMADAVTPPIARIGDRPPARAPPAAMFSFAPLSPRAPPAV